MKFDIYGHFQLEIRREDRAWVAYWLGMGMRSHDDTLVIPSSLTADEIGVFLDDMFHELASPGQSIRMLR